MPVQRKPPFELTTDDHFIAEGIMWPVETVLPLRDGSCFVIGRRGKYALTVRFGSEELAEIFVHPLAYEAS